MSPQEVQAAVLMADVTGSTPLYEALGNAEAQRVIASRLAGLRSVVTSEHGVFVRSKGDDVLAYFEAPVRAVRAARAMMAQQGADSPQIHAGLHYGQIILADGDIFGDSVNLTARLTALANAGEVLASGSLVDQLPGPEARQLQLLDRIRLAGTSAPTAVYSLIGEDASTLTAGFGARGTDPPRGPTERFIPETTIVLSHGGRSKLCREAGSVLIGRLDDCDVVIGRPWVSRRHASVTVRDGKVQYHDRSSLGTYVAIAGGHEFFVRRETVMLTGSGVLSPAVRASQPEAEPVHFEIVQTLSA